MVIVCDVSLPPPQQLLPRAVPAFALPGEALSLLFEEEREEDEEEEGEGERESETQNNNKND